MEGGSTDSEALDLEAVRAAYHRLLSGYAKALGDSQRIHRSRAGVVGPEKEPDEVTKSESTYFGPLIRLLVGSHIRSRIDRLGARFSQLEPALSSSEQAAAYKWVAEQRTLLEKMGSNLPSLRLPGVFVAAPFAITLLSAIGDLSVKAWALVLVVVLVPSFFLLVALIQAYRRKRELFLENAKTVDRKDPHEQTAHSGHNLYRDEEDLFVLLNSRRQPELELDAFTIRLGFTFLAELCFLSLLFLESAPKAVTWGVLALGFAFLAPVVVMNSREHKRLWR
jgi:hypothetical protein